MIRSGIHKLLTLLLLVCITLVSAGQSKRILVADSLYTIQSYEEASKLYKKEWKKSEGKDLDVGRMLARCYDELGDDGKAIDVYGQIAKKQPEAEDLFSYAQLLKSQGKYAQADFVMEEFGSKAKNDSRAYSFAMNRPHLEEMKGANKDTHLRALESNTGMSDFGITYAPEGVAFVSARQKGVPTTRIYERTGEPFLDIFTAKPLEDGSLSEIKAVGNTINSAYHEGNCTFSADGKTMFFTRNAKREGKKGKLVRLEIYSAELKDGDWTNIQPFQWNHQSYSVGHPSLSEDGRRLYFVSDRNGGFGGTDIYVCHLEKDSTWSRPGNLGTLVNTEGNELFPYIHPDDVLYFSSDGHYGLGGLDLFVSPVRDGRTTQSKNLGAPYNSPKDDLTVVFDHNRHTGYVSSNRDNGIDNLYYFSVDYDRPSAVKGLVIDNDTGKPMTTAIAQLYNADGELLEEKEVADDGSFLFFLDKMKCNYFVRVVNQEGWTIFESAPTPCTFEADPINLGKVSVAKRFWKAAGTVKDKESLDPIEGFMATLVNSESGITEIQSTDQRGQVSFSLQPDTDYNIVFEKEGYFTRSGEFTTKGMEPGIVSIERFVTLFFEPLMVDKVIEIENIYFGYDEYVITAESAKELENVVNTMQRNPDIVVEMGSHTDSRGTVEYNMWLCNKRAQAVTDYLVSKGVGKSRLKSRGYGEAQLINKCTDGVECNETQHKENRRIEFKIIGTN